MVASTHRGTNPACKLLAVVVVVIAALISRALWDQKPSAAEKEPEPKAVLTAVGAVNPRISPDGKDAVFSYQGSIWRVPTEGGTMRRLAAGSGFAIEPCWSPDGKLIAFFQGRFWGSGRLKVIEAQSGKAVPQPGDAEILGAGPLFFTPDGQRLVGNLRTQNQLEALRALDLKTGKLELMVRMRSLRQPWALSHDGKWVVNVTTLDQPDEQTGNDGPQVDVWQAPLTGGTGEPELIVRFPARIHDICWSADGKSLYASAELGGVHNDLWRIDLKDPDRPIKITFGQADEDRPSISADGCRILYADNLQGCPGLVVRDLLTETTRSIPIKALDFGLAEGRLSLTVKDKASGEALVARVALEHKDGGFHAPPGAVWRTYRDLGHFYVRDKVEMTLPVGSYKLIAWHGPEYRRLETTVDIKEGALTQATADLERWADPNAKGWYSGENHIHANYGYGEYYNHPIHMADMIEGESLNIGNFVVANSDGNGTFDREFFRGQPDPLSTKKNLLYWNEEFRSTIWGHLTLVNLKHVVEPIYTGFKDTTNPYDIPTMSGIAEKTHRQGGLVNYTHPASRLDDLYRGAYSAKGLPIWAALGQIDTMDVMGSGDQASGAFYHRLLNCGFRLAASAGTDCFLNRIRSWLPGGERAYVKIDGPLTYEKWIAGLRAGRSFVTNGPILEFTADGKGLGDEIRLPAAGKVKVKATASSQHPLDKVEVLYNGKVIAAVPPNAAGLTTELEQTVPVDRSGWLALRVSGKAVQDVKGEFVYAHTSPVYVTVAGQPAGSAADARYFLNWIDRLWTRVQERDRIPGDKWKAEVKKEIEDAKKVYREMVERNP